jgi:hypothetical protein
MVSGQVALSVVLVAGALVLMRSFGEAQEVYPGFDPSRPLALIWAHSSGREGGPSQQRFDAAADRIASVAGVEAVTYARHLPLVGSGTGAALPVQPEGAAPDAPPRRVYFNLVGPRYFEVVGARLLSGRTFTASDFTTAGTAVAIVNAEAARRFWPGAEPLGKVMRVDGVAHQVVGTAADGRIGSLHENAAPVLWLPAPRIDWGETILIARTRSDPAPIVKELARAAGGTVGLRVYQSGTLRTLLKQALYDDWIPSVLGGMLALIGLLLAAGGLYGAVSYATERRLGEFGVRLAVGAQTRQIAALVVRQAAVLCAVGVPIGIALFVFAYRYQAGTLFRNRPVDPAAIFVGSAVAAVVVLAGAVLPAIRAARVDLLQVLRAE